MKALSNRRPGDADRGSAVLLSLAVLMLLLMLAVFFVSSALVERQAASNAAKTTQAREAAESGLQRGLTALAYKFEHEPAAAFSPQKLADFDTQGRYTVPKTSPFDDTRFDPAEGVRGRVFQQSNVVVINRTGKFDPNVFGRPTEMFYVSTASGSPQYQSLPVGSNPHFATIGASPTDIDFQYLASGLNTAPVPPETQPTQNNWLWVLDRDPLARVNLLKSMTDLDTAVAHNRDTWFTLGETFRARCGFPDEAGSAAVDDLWRRYAASCAAPEFNTEEFYPFSHSEEANVSFNHATKATTPRLPLTELRALEASSATLGDFETRLKAALPGVLESIQASRTVAGVVSPSYYELLANLKDFLDADSSPTLPVGMAINASYPSFAGGTLGALPSPLYCGTEATMNISEIKVVGNVMNADIGEVAIELVNFYPRQYLNVAPADAAAAAAAEAADLGALVEVQYTSGTTVYVQKFVAGFGPNPGPVPLGLWASTLCRSLYPENPHAEKKTENITITALRAFLIRKPGIWAKISDSAQTQAQLDAFIRGTDGSATPAIIDLCEMAPLTSLFLDAKTISASRNSDLYPTLKKGDNPPIVPGGLYKVGVYIYVYAYKIPPPGNAYTGDPKNPQPPFYCVGVANVTNNEIDFFVTGDWAAMPWGTTIEVGHIYTYRGAIYVATSTHTKSLSNPVPPDRDLTGDYFLKVFSGLGGIAFEAIDPRGNTRLKSGGEDAWRISGMDVVLGGGATFDQLGSIYYPNPVWFERWDTATNQGRLWSWVPPDTKAGTPGYWQPHAYLMDEPPLPPLVGTPDHPAPEDLPQAIPSTAFIRNGAPRTLWELGAVNRAELWRTLRLAGGTAPASIGSLPDGSYGQGDWLLLDRLTLRDAVYWPDDTGGFDAWFQDWSAAGCPPAGDGVDYTPSDLDWGKPWLFNKSPFNTPLRLSAAGTASPPVGWYFPTLDLWKQLGCPAEGSKVNPNAAVAGPWTAMLRSLKSTNATTIQAAYDDSPGAYVPVPLMNATLAANVAQAVVGNGSGYWNRGLVAIPIGDRLRLANPNYTDRFREEVAGRLANLLSPRYQCFEIRATGRCVLMPEFGTDVRVLATARITAVVERDAYTGTFKVLSQWLDEDL